MLEEKSIQEIKDLSMYNNQYERNTEYTFVWGRLAILLSVPRDYRQYIKILDVGGAESRLSKVLSELGFNVTVIDIKEDDYGKAKFVRANILEHEFEEESFDIIIAISTIEHIGLSSYGQKIQDPDGDKKCMEKIWRWLRKGGFCFITLPYGRPHHPPDFERTYNRKMLQERILFKPWEVLSIEYYRQSSHNPHHFVRCDEFETRYFDSVVCLFLRKPFKNP